MGFDKGNMTVRRFWVNGSTGVGVDAELLEKAAARSFGRDTIRTADQGEFGWTAGDHVQDVRFTLEKNAIADGFSFAMRVDANKAPAELVRSYQRENERAMLEASGREFLSKAEKRSAREQALAQADLESRGGKHRRIKSFPVFWDIAHSQVYLGSTSATAADQLILLFRETFDLGLEPVSAGRWFGRLAWAMDLPEFEALSPAEFVTPPAGSDMLEPDTTKDFLGSEWLLWLWASVANGWDVPGECAYLFIKRLRLDCVFKLTGNLAVAADAPTLMPEAMDGLRLGKRPVKAGMQIAYRGSVCEGVIVAESLAMSGVQVPAAEGATTAREVFEHRIGELRTLNEGLAVLGKAFLRARAGSDWAMTVKRMRDWIAGES